MRRLRQIWAKLMGPSRLTAMARSGSDSARSTAVYAAEFTTASKEIGGQTGLNCAMVPEVDVRVVQGVTIKSCFTALPYELPTELAVRTDD